MHQKDLAAVSKKHALEIPWNSNLRARPSDVATSCASGSFQGMFCVSVERYHVNPCNLPVAVTCRSKIRKRFGGRQRETSGTNGLSYPVSFAQSPEQNCKTPVVTNPQNAEKEFGFQAPLDLL